MASRSSMMRAVRGVAVATIMALGVVACGGGGGKKEAEEPAQTTTDDSSDQVVAEPEIPEEKYIEIKAFFDRKRRIVARCFGKAMDAGEVDKNAKARVMLKMKINTDGTLSNVTVSHSNVKSALLESCIIGKAEKWTVVTLPKAVDYSYLFGFERL